MTNTIPNYNVIERHGNLLYRLICWWHGHVWSTSAPDHYHDGSSSRTHTCSRCGRSLYEGTL